MGVQSRELKDAILGGFPNPKSGEDLETFQCSPRHSEQSLRFHVMMPTLSHINDYLR